MRQLRYQGNSKIFEKYTNIINEIPSFIARPRLPAAERKLVIKTPKEIQKIRESCKFASETLQYSKSLLRPGVSTQYLNDLTHKFIVKHGFYPSPLGYNGFPGSICTSVNNVICHGIPNEADILTSGDVCKIDVTVYRNGYHGDTCATFAIEPEKTSSRLLDMLETNKIITNQVALSIGPGMHLSEVGTAITKCAIENGYQIAAEVCGHGIGKDFHELPFVSHFQPLHSDDDDDDEFIGDDLILEPGMVFTIEPAFVLPEPDDDNDDLIAEVELWPDNWTVASRNHYPSTQFEHTVLITDNGSEVLTALH